MSAPAFVIVGRVRKVHGLAGELAVEAITDRPDVIFASGRRVFAGTPVGTIGREPRELTVSRSRPFKGGLLVVFEEVGSREEADKLRGRYFLVPADEIEPLAEGEVYVHELYGMTVRLPDGATLGEVVDVYELPQGLGLDVRRADGKGTVIVPYRVVTGIDRAARALVAEPPEGLLD